MTGENAKSYAFLNTINEASREQKTSIIEEAKQYRAQRLAEAKELAQKKYDEYILAETENFAAEDGIEAERRATAIKKEIIAARTKITENIFTAVTEKLNAFTQTAEYENFLLRSAKRISEKCEGLPVVIFMRGEDMKFADAVKSVSDNISVETDNAVKIGGLYGICAEKSVKLNDLLETRLEMQKEWFYENSGLSLNH